VPLCPSSSTAPHTTALTAVFSTNQQPLSSSTNCSSTHQMQSKLLLFVARLFVVEAVSLSSLFFSVIEAVLSFHLRKGKGERGRICEISAPHENCGISLVVFLIQFGSIS
ncbi:hypothetical protein HN51_052676, partial [Arachis hypogaea]